MTKRNTKKTPYMPRVQIKMNTGTRVISTKKDKLNSRQRLNRALRDMY